MNLADFNPNDAAQAGTGIFGLPHDAEHANIIIIPIKWEVTVSYGSGASQGPEAIIEASKQLDLCHHDYPELWRDGIWVDAFPRELEVLNDTLKAEAKYIIDAIEEGVDTLNDAHCKEKYTLIEAGCKQLNTWLKERVSHWKSKGKTVGLIGGDHSTPFGYIDYLSEQHTDFGILMLDAHMDLREAFEGFAFSHASIFYNTLRFPQLSKMVQVGIRDYCHEEKQRVADSNNRIQIFYDRDLKRAHFEGKSWKQQVDEIIVQLPQKVYVSVDIDGLDPKLCPNTGTPVPGGLQFEEAAYLMHRLKQSGKEIIGFDLCEVSPGENEWDGNVGARVLYQLCGMAR
jgi:agmatinase